MPYRWHDATPFYKYKGIKIYHVYKDDFETDPYTYIFTTLADDERFSFDIRELGYKPKIIDNNIQTRAIFRWAIKNKKLKFPKGVKYDNG